MRHGLPVWVGLSAKRRGETLASHRDDGPEFATLVDHWSAQHIQALGVMHTSLPDTEEALDLLLPRASMPVMAYPEAGYFRSPDWQFTEVDHETYATTAVSWALRGAHILGGCCGLGPGHIAALSRQLAADHSEAS